MSDFSSTDWLADHLRVSLFSKEIWTTPVEEIFSSIFGSQCESVTSKPGAHEVTAVSTWKGLRLELKRTFNRLDFVAQHAPTETLGPLPFISDAQSLMVDLSKVISTWAATQSQGVIRIALGVNAFLPVSSIEESYNKLREFVRVIDVDVNRFREFRFQVNLPVPSVTSPQLKINRLSTWSSISIRGALIGNDGANFFDENHYVSCMLDINTDANQTTPIDSASIDKLNTELTGIVINILSTGIV